MKKTLITLEEFNQIAIEAYKIVELGLNGIECPKCGSELFDEGNIQSLSNPPQKNIYCKNCNYKGRRIC